MNPRLAASLVCVSAALARPASAESVRCIVGGDKVELADVRVPYDGGALVLSTTNVPARLFPGRRADAYSVDVEAPLFFHGSVRSAPVSVARRSLAWGGAIELAAATELFDVRFDARGQLRATARSGDDVVLEGLPVDCDALTLDAVTSDAARGTAPARNPEIDDFFVPTGPFLTFSREPGGLERVRLRQTSDAYLSLEHLRDEGPWQRPWTRVRVDLGVVAVTGWVARSAIAHPSSFNIVSSSHCRGGLGTCGRGVANEPGVRVGPARVELGTTVYASPGLGAWATVERSQDFIVRHARGSDWATLEEVPGLQGAGACGAMEHAFIPASSVLFRALPTSR